MNKIQGKKRASISIFCGILEVMMILFAEFIAYRFMQYKNVSLKNSVGLVCMARLYLEIFGTIAGIWSLIKRISLSAWIGVIINLLCLAREIMLIRALL